MRKASWILLTIVGVLVVFASVAGSMTVAYFSHDRETIVGKSLDQLGLAPEVQKAILARRATAAGFAAAFGTMFLFVVLVPYRRGEVWAWYAILVSLLVLNVIILLRKPILGVFDGIPTAALPGGISLLALLLDVGRLKKS